MLRLSVRGVVVASIVLLGQVEPVYGQPKPSAAAAASTNKAAPSKTPPQRIQRVLGPAQEVAVCVRPPELHADQYEWGYDTSDRVIAEDVKKRVQEERTRFVFKYDPSAPKTSVDHLPNRHKGLRCPGDTRPPGGSSGASAPETMPVGILASLPTRANQRATLPEAVKIFCNKAEHYSNSSGAAGKQAQEFVGKLRQAILTNQPMPPMTSNDLSEEAAGLLFVDFNKDITAALVYREVVAPRNVLRKFMEFVGDPQWKSFALIDKRWVIKSKVGTADTAPTVILKRTVHEEVSKLVDDLTAQAQTAEALKGAYEKAYAGHDSWIQAIAPYFAK